MTILLIVLFVLVLVLLAAVVVLWLDTARMKKQLAEVRNELDGAKRDLVTQEENLERLATAIVQSSQQQPNPAASLIESITAMRGSIWPTVGLLGYRAVQSYLKRRELKNAADKKPVRSET